MRQTQLIATVAAVLIMFSAARASAQLSVKILDAPSSLYSYEPVFVIFEVRNKGAEPLLLPVGGCLGNSTNIEVGLHGQPLEDRCYETHSQAGLFAWLLPGERRLFLEQMDLGHEGVFEIQAVVRSDGNCLGALVGSAASVLPPARMLEGVGLLYECWTGEARSQTILVNVEVPTSEIDRAAAELVKVPIPGKPLYRLLPLLGKLRQQFPTSHYTYAAASVGGNTLGLVRVAAEQPDNPLNRFAVGAIEARVAALTAPCMPPSALQATFPEKWWPHYEALLAKYEPPQSLKDYVEQIKRDGLAEKCPEMQAEPASGSDASTPPASEQRTPSNTVRDTLARNRQPAQPTPSAPLLSYPTPRGLGTPNMGFKQPIAFSPVAVERVLWLSLPYRYTPPDVGTPGILDAEDLCQDLGPSSTYTAVLRWNEPTSTFVEHACGGPSPFPLVKGMGYGARIAASHSVRTYLTGGHDDDFTFSIPPTGGSQMSWISLPYHLRRTNPLPGAFTAEDLCRQIGVSEVRAIVRQDATTGIFHAYVCGSSFETPFEIKRGTAYGVINQTGQTITWQPEHH